MITREQAQAQLDALLDSVRGDVLTVTIGGRTVSYNSAADIQAQINYWQRILAGLDRQARGLSQHGASVARFGTPL